MPEKSCFFLLLFLPFSHFTLLLPVIVFTMSNILHFLALFTKFLSCPLLIAYVRLLYRRGISVFPSIYSSINLFFHPIRNFRYLSSFTYQLLILTYGCVFIFDSNLFSTSLLSQFQHSSFISIFQSLVYDV